MRTWYERSRELAQRLGDTAGLGQTAQNIGIVCQLEGEAARQHGDEKTATARFRDALRSLSEANRVDHEQGNQPFQARSHGQLAQVRLLLGELAKAERDAVREELERRAEGPGGGGLTPQFVEAIEQLAYACAQAGFGEAQPQDLDPGAESALAQIEKLPAPLPELAAFLRRLAARELPSVPANLPPELKQVLGQLLQAIREAHSL